MTLLHTRRSIITAAMGAAIGAPSLTFAENFPDRAKPIRGISPVGAGSSVDTMARAYARAMTEILGANVVIENRAGAEGVIAMDAVKNAPPDGYTILFTTVSTQAINPHLFKRLSYDPQADFVPLAGTAKTSLFLNLGPSTSFKTTREFFAAAKANPGRYSIGSVSATTRLAAQMVAKAAGIELLPVPYKNFADAMTNLAGGQLDAIIVDAAAAWPYYKQGVRPVAATGATRVSILQDVETLQEQGLAGFELLGWFAAYAPARTPAAVVNVLTDAVRRASKSKYLQDFYAAFAMEPLDLAGEQLAAFQRTEIQKWGNAVRDAGLAGTL